MPNSNTEVLRSPLNIREVAVLMITSRKKLLRYGACRECYTNVWSKNLLEGCVTYGRYSG